MVTLKSTRAFRRISSNLPRTSCSGRAKGGLSTILGESELGSLEVRMRVFSVQRRYLVPRKPTVRPLGTTTVTLRRWDKDLCASDVTIRDAFSRLDAHLRFSPFSAGTRWVPTSPNYRTNGIKLEYLR